MLLTPTEHFVRELFHHYLRLHSAEYKVAAIGTWYGTSYILWAIPNDMLTPLNQVTNDYVLLSKANPNLTKSWYMVCYYQLHFYKLFYQATLWENVYISLIQGLLTYLISFPKMHSTIIIYIMYWKQELGALCTYIVCKVFC